VDTIVNSLNLAHKMGWLDAYDTSSGRSNNPQPVGSTNWPHAHVGRDKNTPLGGRTWQGSRFTQTLDTHTDKLGQAAAHVSGCAVEVASLGDAFRQAVQLFAKKTWPTTPQVSQPHLNNLTHTLEKPGPKSALHNA
jgi:hypothetical protein